MPRIYVEWFEGRSKEVRDALAKKITEGVMDTVPNVTPEMVNIVFKENTKDKVYRAGVSAADR